LGAVPKLRSICEVGIKRDTLDIPIQRV